MLRLCQLFHAIGVGPIGGCIHARALAITEYDEKHAGFLASETVQREWTFRLFRDKARA